jgi:hypothetical protein
MVEERGRRVEREEEERREKGDRRLSYRNERPVQTSIFLATVSPA